MGGFSSFGTGSKGSSISHENTDNKKSFSSSPLKQVISLLEELDESRQIVARKEQELENAKQNMDNITQKVMAKLASLEPSTKGLLKGILGQIDGETVSLIKKETEGKSK